MSVTICPHCRKDLSSDDAEGIYCEHCGGNITADPPPTLNVTDGVFLLPEHAEALLSQIEFDLRLGRIRPDAGDEFDPRLHAAFDALGAALRTLRAF